MSRNPGTTTVVGLRAPRVSDHGTPVGDWSGELEQWDITGCNVQPGASAEDAQYRDAQRVAFTILAPYGEAAQRLTGDDRIRFRGHDYPIEGDPEWWDGSNPDVTHVKILVASWRDLT